LEFLNFFSVSVCFFFSALLILVKSLCIINVVGGEGKGIGGVKVLVVLDPKAREERVADRGSRQEGTKADSWPPVLHVLHCSSSDCISGAREGQTLLVSLAEASQ
jgi:hypothetical protein